jgi:hypothetical protein
MASTNLRSRGVISHYALSVDGANSYIQVDDQVETY